MHPELFNICDQLKISNDKYEANIWISPVNHVVSFFSGDSALSEVIAPKKAMLPTRSLLHNQPLRKEKVFEHNTTCGLKYISSFQVERMSSRIMRASHRDFSRCSKPSGRLINFRDDQHGALSGFTYYSYELLPAGLHVMVFHALAGVSTMIKTQSIFEICEK